MILDTIKPYLYGAAAIALVASYAALWIYRGHIDGQACSATLAKEQNNEYESYLAYDRAIQTATQVAAASAKQQQYQYQSDLAAANARAASADDTASQLQHAFTLYADGGWFKGSGDNSGKATACVSVSEANVATGRLAAMASTLDADGLHAARDAASCAVRLSACEKWADTVESEFGVKK